MKSMVSSSRLLGAMLIAQNLAASGSLVVGQPKVEDAIPSTSTPVQNVNLVYGAGDAFARTPRSKDKSMLGFGTLRNNATMFMLRLIGRDSGSTSTLSLAY